jgi:hypothetical protein
VIAGLMLSATSRLALAGSVSRTALDSCFVNCGNGGACNASTSWYNFWDDCTCTCGTGGNAVCQCN